VKNLNLQGKARMKYPINKVMNRGPFAQRRRLWYLAASAAVLFSLLALPHPAWAQQTAAAPLTLNAALAYAHEHSPRLAATQQGVATQQAAVGTAQAERLPGIDLGASLRGTSPLTETALGFPLTPLADIPETQPFSHGHVNGVVSAALPLYTGGRISTAIKLAKAERGLAQTNVRDVERDLDFDVTSTYATLVELDRDIQAAQESVKALEESRRVVSQMLVVGKVARVDNFKVKARLADVQDKLIEYKNARQIEAGQLNALLGRPIDTSVVVETALPRQPAPLSPQQLAQATTTGNTKYQLAQARVGVAERSVAEAKSQLRPSLSLAADFVELSADPFSAYKGGAIAGFAFNIPLFDRPLNKQIAEAKSREIERRDQLAQVRLDAIQRTRTACLQMQDAEERIRATRASIGYAREALRVEQEKYSYGRSIIENVLDAQAALLTSEADYYRALADYTTARAALKRETGL
jgi:outer membrane protein